MLLHIGCGLFTRFPSQKVLCLHAADSEKDDVCCHNELTDFCYCSTLRMRGLMMTQDPRRLCPGSRTANLLESLLKSLKSLVSSEQRPKVPESCTSVLCHLHLTHLHSWRWFRLTQIISNSGVLWDTAATANMSRSEVR